MSYRRAQMCFVFDFSYTKSFSFRKERLNTCAQSHSTLVKQVTNTYAQNWNHCRCRCRCVTIHEPENEARKKNMYDNIEHITATHIHTCIHAHSPIVCVCVCLIRSARCIRRTHRCVDVEEFFRQCVRYLCVTWLLFFVCLFLFCFFCLSFQFVECL